MSSNQKTSMNKNEPSNADCLQRLVRPTTAIEVRWIDEIIQAKAQHMAEHLHTEMCEWNKGILCRNFLGFSVLHNRSPKKSRRLKHAISMRMLESIPAIKWA